MNKKFPSPVQKNKYDKQIALVLQGGGALGSYQAGVYEALAENSYQPDWVRTRCPRCPVLCSRLRKYMTTFELQGWFVRSIPDR